MDLLKSYVKCNNKNKQKYYNKIRLRNNLIDSKDRSRKKRKNRNNKNSAMITTVPL